MDTTTIFRGCGSCIGRHTAAKPTKPLASTSSSSSSSFNLTATRSNSSSFNSRVTILSSYPSDSRPTGWPLPTSDSADHGHAAADQQNNDRPGIKLPIDPGGDWGRARHLSAPNKWWKRDLKKRRQQLKDVEAKQAVLLMTGKEADEAFCRRPGLCKSSTRNTDEPLRIEHERDGLSATIQNLEKRVSHHGSRRRHYSDMIRHALHYTPYNRRTIEKAEIEKDFHNCEFIHLSRELAWAKQEYDDIERTEKRAKAMIVRWDLCKPRKSSTPISEPSPGRIMADVVTPNTPVKGRQSESATQPAFLRSILATCVVS